MMDEPKKVGDSPIAPQGDPSQGEPQDTLPPDPYAGKTPEELVAILKEKEKMIGRQGQEKGDLQAKLSDLEQRVNILSQFGNQPKEPDPLETPFGRVGGQEPMAEEVPPDFFNRPRQYVEHWQEERDRRRLEELVKRDTEIKLNLFRAKPVIEQAKKESPHLFQGLNDIELDTALYNGLANNLLSPYSLADTRTYKQAALWLQGEKSGYRFNPNVPQGSPVPATPTEPYTGYQPPGQGGRPEETIEMDDLTRELIAHRPKGMTEKEFLAKVREERRR